MLIAIEIPSVPVPGVKLPSPPSVVLGRSRTCAREIVDADGASVVPEAKTLPIILPIPVMTVVACRRAAEAHRAAPGAMARAESLPEDSQI